MANISVRGIDPKTLATLKAMAKEQNTSVNSLVVSLLDRATGGTSEKSLYSRHEDLSELAGTWNQQDVEDFEANTAGLREIDPEQWEN